jgi:hypothetical protein
MEMVQGFSTSLLLVFKPSSHTTDQPRITDHHHQPTDHHQPTILQLFITDLATCRPIHHQSPFPTHFAKIMFFFVLAALLFIRAFAPDVILVSCGFDAARGDPLGRYDVTPLGYAHMTRLLQTQVPSAQGKVIR